MKKNNLFQRFRYWLDKRMARGTGSMIRALLFATIFMILFLGQVMNALHYMQYGIVLRLQLMRRFLLLMMVRYFLLSLMELRQSLVFSLRVS